MSNAPMADKPTAASTLPLLAADEPPAVRTVNREGSAPFLLICDHATRLVPRALDSLGLDDALLRRHIAWDIGAAEVAMLLSQSFDAPLVATGYSRLVIDCNRALEHPGSIPPASDGIEVPGNRALAAASRARRVEALFTPYHRAIDEALDGFRAKGRVPALVSIHSCTPVFGGFERPWHIGVLWNRDARIAGPLLDALRGNRDLVVGDNEPYSAREEPRGFTVERHAERKGYPHVSVEIRQDLIDTHLGVAEWAATLGSALAPILADPALYEIFEGAL